MLERGCEDLFSLCAATKALVRSDTEKVWGEVCVSVHAEGVQWG